MVATEYFGYTITNVGPLTTTFTPQPQCTTLTDDIRAGMVTDNSTLIYSPVCTFADPKPACIPSAGALVRLHELWEGSRIGQGYVPYYSPGLYCPSGWETVGAVASESGNATLSATGVFTKDRAFQSDVVAAGLPAAAFITAMIEESETAIWCCPTGHNVDIFGQCVSSIETFDEKKYRTLTNVCQLNVAGEEALHTVTSFDGTTWNPPLLSIEKSIAETSTRKQHLSDVAPTSDFSVYHTAGAIQLVHKASDLDAKDDKDGDGSKDDKGDKDDSAATGKDDDKGAASSLRTFTMFSAGAVVAGILAGMGMILA